MAESQEKLPDPGRQQRNALSLGSQEQPERSPGDKTLTEDQMLALLNCPQPTCLQSLLCQGRSCALVKQRMLLKNFFQHSRPTCIKEFQYICWHITLQVLFAALLFFHLLARVMIADNACQHFLRVIQWAPLMPQFKAGLHENLPLQLARSQQRATKISFRWSKMGVKSMACSEMTRCRNIMPL